MQERYEEAIKATFKYLDDGAVAGSYAEAIVSHMKLLGFEVYCTYDYDQSVICVYPMQYNLPTHIWRK